MVAYMSLLAFYLAIREFKIKHLEELLDKEKMGQLS